MSDIPDDGWEALIGSRFRSPWGDLHLSDVERRRAESFSLVFTGPSRPAPQQGTITLQHESGITPTLFLVPIAGDDETSTYEAVFTRRSEGPTA